MINLDMFILEPCLYSVSHSIEDAEFTTPNYSGFEALGESGCCVQTKKGMLCADDGNCLRCEDDETECVKIQDIPTPRLKIFRWTDKDSIWRRPITRNEQYHSYITRQTDIYFLEDWRNAFPGGLGIVPLQCRHGMRVITEGTVALRCIHDRMSSPSVKITGKNTTFSKLRQDEMQKSKNH